MTTNFVPTHPAAQLFPAEARLVEYFRDLRPGLPDGDGGSVRRAEAIARIERDGLPNRRVEEWKYTDLRALLREAAPPAPRPDASLIDAARAGARVLADVPAVRIDFVNGHLVDGGEALAGVTVTPLARALAEGHPALADLDQVEVARGNTLVELNTAFLGDGIIVHVGAGQDIAVPLHLRFINHGDAPFATSVRVLVLVEKGASLTIAESHEGTIAAQPNSLVAFMIGDGARVEHVRVNAEAAGTLALSTVTAALGAKADFRSINLVAGGSASRHQLFVAYEGEDARATLGGVTVIAGEEHADTTLVVDHAVPGGESRELFKTIVDGDATGVFQGKIIVRQDAQKTDGRMMSAALLLSPGATMNNKPELEIWADDVQCAHGATCGELDEELLFYLKARGLPQAEAEALLLQAFIGEAFEELISGETMREAMNAIAVKRLEKRS
ncbi:Fe-S cluster assembly protein SufD [Pseudochelatococcus sp. B33]